MVDIHNLNPGVKVKVVANWNNLCEENINGRMDKYLGQTVTVSEVLDDIVLIEEDTGDCEFHEGGHWYWNAHCFECILDDEDDKNFDISSEAEILSLILN